MENEFRPIISSDPRNEHDNFSMSDFRFRLFSILTAFIIAFCMIGGQMIFMAIDPKGDKIQSEIISDSIGSRKEIVDRQGKLLSLIHI